MRNGIPTSDGDRFHELPWDRPVSRRDIFRYGGALGFGAVGASLLASCGPVAQLTASGDFAKPGTTPPAKAKYLVVLIVDAGRGDYLGYGHLPNIKSLIANGTYYPNAFSGIMEATTPACHVALGTGSFPKNNGGVLGFWWENSSDEKYSCANLADPATGSAAIDPNTIETLIREAGAPTMAALLKDVDPTAKVYTSSGVKFYAADAVGGPEADYITYFWNDGPNMYRPLSIPGHQALPASILNDPSLTSNDWYSMTTDSPGLQDALVVDLATKVIERERPRIVILNLPEMDWPVAHLYGGPADAPAVTQLMENADKQLGKLMDLYRNLGIFHETVFCLMGDHGVLPLERQVNTADIPGAVANAGTTINTGDFHTGGFLWINDPTRAMKASTYIDDLKEPGVSAAYFLGDIAGQRTYLPSPQTASRITPQLDNAYRYLLETMNGANAPHVVLLYEERTGTLGAGGNYPWKGDHGGASWASQGVALTMAGPGIRRGYRSQHPARLVDLAPTFLRLLGAPYPSMDGVALADAFASPTAEELTAQTDLAREIVPVAATLRRQSLLDVKGARVKSTTSALKKTAEKNIPLNPNY